MPMDKQFEIMTLYNNPLSTPQGFHHRLLHQLLHQHVRRLCHFFNCGFHGSHNEEADR